MVLKELIWKKNNMGDEQPVCLGSIVFYILLITKKKSWDEYRRRNSSTKKAIRESDEIKEDRY